MTIIQLMERLQAKSPELADIVVRDGGFRGLFDPGAQEWNQRSMDVKVSVIVAIGRAGIGIADQRLAFIDLMARYSYPHIEADQAFFTALDIYFAWFRGSSSGSQASRSANGPHKA